MTSIYVNFALCVIILAMGTWLFLKKRDMVPLLIGLAFALFGLSHLATILAVTKAYARLLIIIRTLGYIIVALALYLESGKK